MGSWVQDKECLTEACVQDSWRQMLNVISGRLSWEGSSTTLTRLWRTEACVDASDFFCNFSFRFCSGVYFSVWFWVSIHWTVEQKHDSSPNTCGLKPDKKKLHRRRPESFCGSDLTDTSRGLYPALNEEKVVSWRPTCALDRHGVKTLWSAGQKCNVAFGMSDECSKIHRTDLSCVLMIVVSQVVRIPGVYVLAANWLETITASQVGYQVLMKIEMQPGEIQWSPCSQNRTHSPDFQGSSGAAH